MSVKQALGLPALNAWVLTDVSDRRTTFERNPYYWHIDLPATGLCIVMMSHGRGSSRADQCALAGQVNIASAEDIALSEMPLYVQNAEKGENPAFTTGSFNWPLLLFLQSGLPIRRPNSLWQKLVSDPEHRFGKALAAAINPDDVNKAVYFNCR